MQNTTTKYRLTPLTFVRFMFYTNNYWLLLAILMKNRFFIFFHGLTLMFYFTAFAVDRARKSAHFYIPFFDDIPDELYWLVVMLIPPTSKALFAPHFGFTNPLVQGLSYLLVVIVAGSLLMAYQNESWTSEQNEKDDSRFKFLYKKAGLTSEELEVMEPTVVSLVGSQQRKPILLYAVEIIFSILVATFINHYAEAVLTLVQ